MQQNRKVSIGSSSLTRKDGTPGHTLPWLIQQPNNKGGHLARSRVVRLGDESLMSPSLLICEVVCVLCLSPNGMREWMSILLGWPVHNFHREVKTSLYGFAFELSRYVERKILVLLFRPPSNFLVAQAHRYGASSLFET